MNIFCHTWSSPEVYIKKTVRVYIDLFDDALKNPICTIRTTKPELMQLHDFHTPYADNEKFIQMR